MSLVVCFEGLGKGSRTARIKEMSRGLGAGQGSFRSAWPVADSKAVIYV